MDILAPTPLLGGLSPQLFMRRHWQKKPRLIRQAVPGGAALPNRSQLFELAGSDAVESRLVMHDGTRWRLRHGPFKRTALPPLKRPHWSLLVQGLDLHLDAAHELLARFRFVPDARLDDLMLSYATDGGGVGPHIDSYDVFLLQISGRRRWRIGRVRHALLVADAPLKILANFEAEDEWLLEPGDMLYLPPGWGHDGVAVGECMTASIGFRAPGRDALAREVAQRLLDAAEPVEHDSLYRDPGQPASAEPGRITPALRSFARDALARLYQDEQTLACALGEVLSEPKPGVWFEARPAPEPTSLVARLDRRSRMLYDDRFVFLNGESFRAGGRDATLMRRLADRRRLVARDVAALSPAARGLLGQWVEAGWVHHEAD